MRGREPGREDKEEWEGGRGGGSLPERFQIGRGGNEARFAYQSAPSTLYM